MVSPKTAYYICGTRIDEINFCLFTCVTEWRTLHKTAVFVTFINNPQTAINAHQLWLTQRTLLHCCTWRTCSGSARCRRTRTRRAFRMHRHRHCGHTDLRRVLEPCVAVYQRHCQTSWPPACRSQSQRVCRDHQSPTVNSSIWASVTITSMLGWKWDKMPYQHVLGSFETIRQLIFRETQFC